MSDEMIVGIDLGTTNSEVAVVRHGQVEVLGENGEKILPSVVGLDPAGRLLVGTPARNQWILAPDRTVRSIKRKMGQDVKVPLGPQLYTPQEISAIILRTLKERAERQLGQPVRKAVITVPAFFNEIQREATREAGELAGLEVVRIINEPTAAALTYEAYTDRRERLLVYDLGGGTFDVSIVQVERGVVEVLASHGDTRLGGDDFDRLLLDDVCEAFLKEEGVDLRQSPISKSRMLQSVEAAKIRLSDEAFTTLVEEFIAEKGGKPLHLRRELARSEYEDLIEGLLHKTLECVDRALSEAKLHARQIDKVILVGGASRTPMVRQLLEERLGQPVRAEVHPELCVAMGAALQGAMIAGVDAGPVLVDITPHTLGIAVLGLVDDAPSPFKYSPIIKRNTPLPASRSELYRTVLDRQQKVAIEVYQGENEDVRFNELVGEFMLDGLAEVDAGNPILVRFDLDLDGILKVTAREKATGREKQLVIDNQMSRFRKSNRESARQRLEAAFAAAAVAAVPSGGAEKEIAGGAPTARLVSSPGPAELPEELRTLVRRSEELIGQAERIAPQAPPEDAQEIRRLVQDILAAIAGRSPEEVAKHADLTGMRPARCVRRGQRALVQQSYRIVGPQSAGPVPAAVREVHREWTPGRPDGRLLTLSNESWWRDGPVFEHFGLCAHGVLPHLPGPAGVDRPVPAVPKRHAVAAASGGPLPVGPGPRFGRPEPRAMARGPGPCAAGPCPEPPAGIPQAAGRLLPAGRPTGRGPGPGRRSRPALRGLRAACGLSAGIPSAFTRPSWPDPGGILPLPMRSSLPYAKMKRCYFVWKPP